ncbi:MAG: DUF6531 domain-containing protein, partial [Nitrospirota bacterium]|nr:DUF6531 domain-containing protein [Nitrospirota bacterium]
GEDSAGAISVDASGNVYVTGSSLGSGTYSDYATVKYDSNGNQMWVARYNGPGNNWDYAGAISVDATGNVYVTGWSPGSGTSSDYATVKYDSNGNQMWVARYNGPGNRDDYARAISIDVAGNVYVTGQIWDSGTDYDYATVKYSQCPLNTYYQDSDNDTFGNASVTTQACTPPAGYVTDNTDCNDGNASINLGAAEACNGVDDNCNTQIDEGAQNTLSGTLMDAITDKPLSAVIITVDGTPSATTDSNGLFSVSGLSCGVHTVEVSVSGYYDYIYLADTTVNPILNIDLTKPETVYGPDAPSGYISEPVNTATGNYIFNRKELEISGRGLPFVFERNYNSQDAQDGPLGFGWNHNYNTALTV